MATNPNELPVQYFRGGDGLQLAYREMGEGRPLVLIHGFFSTATVNWVRYGHAAKIAALGYRVVMPDLRGHGDSAKPHDAASYPPDLSILPVRDVDIFVFESYAECFPELTISSGDRGRKTQGAILICFARAARDQEGNAEKGYQE